MATYDPEKEKITKEEAVVLSFGMKVKAKIYSYNGGEEKFKLLFIGESRRGEEYFTSKFPPLTNKKDVNAILKLMKKVSEGLNES